MTLSLKSKALVIETTKANLINHLLTLSRIYLIAFAIDKTSLYSLFTH